MLEQSHRPTGLDHAIRSVELDEREIAAQRLISISEQLAELAKLAKALVRPIELSAHNNEP